MRAAVALALAIRLVSSAIPVAAQERIETTPGPIARAALREAARLGTAQQGGQSPNPDWARVRRLAPGTQVTVTVSGSPPGVRYVILANEFDLTVLNLTDPAIPPAVRSVLLDAAENHPEYFAAAQKGATFELGQNVRMGPDGVFVADRKVVDLGQVVESIMQRDVGEIRGATRTRGSVVGAIGGAAGGLLLGYVLALNLAYKQCGGNCTDEKVLMGLSLVGLPVAAGVLGYTAFGRKRADIIYRAP